MRESGNCSSKTTKADSPEGVGLLEIRLHSDPSLDAHREENPEPE